MAKPGDCKKLMTCLKLNEDDKLDDLRKDVCRILTKNSKKFKDMEEAAKGILTKCKQYEKKNKAKLGVTQKGLMRCLTKCKISDDDFG
jgi:hypothetical protein